VLLLEVLHLLDVLEATGISKTAGLKAAKLSTTYGVFAALTWPISTRQGPHSMACKLVFYNSCWWTGWNLLDVLHWLNVLEATGVSRTVIEGLQIVMTAISTGMLAAAAVKLTWPSKTSRQGASSKQDAWGMAYKFLIWFRLFLTAGFLVMTVFPPLAVACSMAHLT
jgi:hypothetical protein